MSQAIPSPSGRPVAELDGRFYAFTLDRGIAWSLDGVVALVAYRTLIEPGQVVAGVAVIVATVLLVGAAFAVVLGLLGTSPGLALVGLRVVGEPGGAPIGVGPALLRQLILGVATLPTFGIGVAALAWTAVMDPGGRRRGWHDHVAHSTVVDVRPVTGPVTGDAPEVDVRPRHVVNLTAMRLVPTPQAAPIEAPPRPPRASTPPRQQLGYPLVPDASAVRATPAPTTRWRVSFDSGESFVVEGPGLVGRRPEPRPGEPVRHLVPLRSSDMSLSKTHAQFQVMPDDALVVVDRGSTNGSILIRAGVAKELTAGRAATLLDGDHVRFGDREMAVARES